MNVGNYFQGVRVSRMSKLERGWSTRTRLEWTDARSSWEWYGYMYGILRGSCSTSVGEHETSEVRRSTTPPIEALQADGAKPLNSVSQMVP